jgi:CRISPR-associated protein Cas1
MPGVPFLGETITATTRHGVEALSHPLETVVYADRQGSLLRSRGDRLVVEHQDQPVFKLNLRRIRQVVCLGRVGMTTAFLHQALACGIDVVLLTQSGGPGGRLCSLEHTDPTVRRAQYRTADDAGRSLELARSFVDGKIANMRIGLLRADRRAPDRVRADVAATLETARLVLADVGTLAEVMGHEGMASREYFRAWRLVLEPEWGFTSRQRRPPPDQAVGFLHQIRWGRPNLALDLMEEFRPLIVDTVVLRCATTGMVRPEEFETIPDRGRLLNAKARQTFLAAYERRMLTLFTHAPTGRRVSYRVGLGL